MSARSVSDDGLLKVYRSGFASGVASAMTHAMQREGRPVPADAIADFARRAAYGHIEDLLVRTDVLEMMRQIAEAGS